MQLTSRVDILRCAAKLAGDRILAIYDGVVEVFEKDDNSPLTQADLQADEAIREVLLKHFPEVTIWSEESMTQQPGNTGESFFLVDPLDGTKEFIKRNGEFTVNIAYIEQGRVVCSVVYAPVMDEMFFCDHSIGAYSEIRGEFTKLTVQPFNTASVRVLLSRSHLSDETRDWLTTLNKPIQEVAVGSSLKFCRIAQGKADLYPRFGPTCQWDTAAAQGVLEAAGGVVVDERRQPLTYALNRPKLNPNFFAASSLEILKS